MVAEKYLRAGIVVAASLAIVSSACLPAFAQMNMQTPRGDQTVAPSQMPQQPSLKEDFGNKAKLNQGTIPPQGGATHPGVPGIQPPGNNTANLKGNAAMTPATGGVVLPEGVPSSVRIGPVEPVPIWQRAALALWMTMNLVVMLVVAFSLTLMKNRDISEHGGHIIRPDTTDPRFGGSTGVI